MSSAVADGKCRSLAVAVVALVLQAACATTRTGHPASWSQQQSAIIGGYTTRDGRHHPCDCRATLAADDRLRFERRLDSPPMETRASQTTLLAELPREEVVSLDLLEVDLQRTAVALAILATAVALLISFGVAWSHSCYASPNGCFR